MQWLQAIIISACLLFGAASCEAAMEPHANDTKNEEAAIKIAHAFEETNVTTSLEDVEVKPLSVESGDAEVVHKLKPVTAATTVHHVGFFLSLPLGSAPVAIEAAALLVSGATIAVLVIAKIKARSTVNPDEYDKGLMEPMLESLPYSDMDYAAI
ncbi:uncharacterized protein PHALS_07735 [Plasmopara halstedii]|uniref:RxLR-like protein n=1 Tax=Plasmopara halstedii TaxID=4781 RepID=A0A0N7L8I9_PLAHL|nr:uncharacterized protein PHALS_07735 [Plasmopara halstedii]CEG50003.1 hypothetical protein PHALS_07735 [Plasmopara halstedii]|eukprot:XP_024586372.1 hypothetical protein PHALS_07735 [Plasmopara halstedii]